MISLGQGRRERVDRRRLVLPLVEDDVAVDVYSHAVRGYRVERISSRIEGEIALPENREVTGSQGLVRRVATPRKANLAVRSYESRVSRQVDVGKVTSNEYAVSWRRAGRVWRERVGRVDGLRQHTGDTAVVVAVAAIAGCD